MTDVAEDSVYADERPVAAGPAPTEGRACDICGKTYKNRLGLSTHQAMMHGIPGGKTSGERQPGKRESGEARPVRGRTRLDKLGSNLASGAAWLATQFGRYPVARVLQLEAPAIGPAFEDAVKGTMLDRPLQPLARLMASGSKLGALGGWPAATYAFHANPNPITQAAFVTSMELALPLVISSLKDAKKKQDKLEADLSAFAELFGRSPGEPMTIDDLARWIFAEPEGPPPPTVEEPVAETVAV